MSANSFEYIFWEIFTLDYHMKNTLLEDTYEKEKKHTSLNVYIAERIAFSFSIVKKTLSFQSNLKGQLFK